MGRGDSASHKNTQTLQEDNGDVPSMGVCISLMCVRFMLLDFSYCDVCGGVFIADENTIVVFHRRC